MHATRLIACMTHARDSRTAHAAAAHPGEGGQIFVVGHLGNVQRPLAAAAAAASTHTLPDRTSASASVGPTPGRIIFSPGLLIGKPPNRSVFCGAHTLLIISTPGSCQQPATRAIAYANIQAFSLDQVPINGPEAQGSCMPGAQPCCEPAGLSSLLLDDSAWSGMLHAKWLHLPRTKWPGWWRVLNVTGNAATNRS